MLRLPCSKESEMMPESSPQRLSWQRNSSRSYRTKIQCLNNSKVRQSDRHRRFLSWRSKLRTETILSRVCSRRQSMVNLHAKNSTTWSNSWRGLSASTVVSNHFKALTLSLTTTVLAGHQNFQTSKHNKLSFAIQPTWCYQTAYKSVLQAPKTRRSNQIFQPASS